MDQDVITTQYEKSVAHYWDTKRDDAINLLTGRSDGLYHHHDGVGPFDPAVLALPAPEREPALLRELHRLENDQAALVLGALALAGTDPGDRLLDAGSGRGGTAFMLHDLFGCRVDGVTVSEYQVEFGRRLAAERGCADRVAFHLRNMLHTGFPAGAFDGAVTNESSMYVDLGTLFAEMARVVRPGGRHVLITWCLDDVRVGSGSGAETGVAAAEAINLHYGCRLHPRSGYFAALAEHGFVPYLVKDLTAEVMPYWELRRRSAHRTGIEDAFLHGCRTGALNCVLIAADRGTR